MSLTARLPLSCLKTGVVKTACLGALGAVLAAADPGLVIDFDHPNDPLPKLLAEAGDTTSALSIADAPDEKTKGMCIAWKATHSPFFAAQWLDRTAITGLDRPDFKATMFVSVHAADPQNLGSVLVQLMDNAGQTLQWRKPARELQPGAWTTLQYDLDGAHPYQIWGGDGSGKVQPPVSLLAVIVDMDRSAPAGEVWFDDVVIKPVAAAVVH